MFGLDRIRVSDRIRLNPYPIHIHSKKSDFIHIHIHYPVNGFFYCLTESNRVGNPRIQTHFPSLPLTEQMVIRPYLVSLLPTFHDMESENLYSHIREFEEVCNTFKEETATVELMRIKLFPFTLKDKAKIWLNSLRPKSI